MIYGSVCSGIEAATVAWEPLGWQPAFFAEIDKFPRSVLAHHYPDIPNAGDFTTIKGDEYGTIDLLVGGTPCQDFSIAGLRAGMDGERGQLTVEFARLAHRLVAEAGTRWLAWENVPGVLSIDSGGAFATFLSILANRSVRVPDGGWSNSGIIEGGSDGFGLAYRILDAQHFGVPQRRRRVFVIGYFGDWRRAAAVLFERHGLSGNPSPSRKTRQNITYDIAPCIGASGRGFERTGDTRGQDCVVPVHADMRLRESRAGGERCDSTLFGGVPDSQSDAEATSRMSASSHPRRSGSFASTGDIAHCLNAGGMGRQDYETETLITHALRGEGFDASEDGTGRGTPLVPVAAHTTGNGFWQEGLGTLRAREQDSHENLIALATAYRTNAAGQIMDQGDIAAAVTTMTDPTSQFIAFSCKDSGADAGDISPTLRSMGHDGSHANAGGQVAVVIPIADQATRFAGTDGSGNQAGKGHGLGVGEPGDPMYTITSGDKHAIAIQAEELRDNPDSGDGRAPSETVAMLKCSPKYGDTSPHVASGMAVRRLTPVECERLQGFPDGYTKISDKTADGPRYKALGNSMAVPVMRWIGERIQMVDSL